MSTVVFDVNETLSDLAPMAGRFEQVGAPGGLARTWFAATLRDGFALTVAGAATPFAAIARSTARNVLAAVLPAPAVDDAVEHVVAGFGELSVHDDVVPGVQALAEAGHRLVTLTNGAAAIADGLLTRAGVRDRFDLLLSVEDAGAWKPHPTAYRYAAARCGVRPADLVLVAVHPWDIDGAHRAGLRTAYVHRTPGPYPEVFAMPDLVVRRIGELVDQL